ncbi:hypothetical protein IFM89_030101 [Coptis chinensis]|uniref:Uncharacterized protein n=1 Tax=Coptis chinensis TaxID=261450 RepID=A0A835I717_9MAGN|nr:hypothetical protein IFM89_030101 [Coptis chinensis]
MRFRKMEKFISFIMVLFLVIGMGSSDLVQTKSSSELVSDGLNHVNHSPNSLFNPTRNNYVVVGSEIILSQLGPGIVGASAFRILGALPGTTLAFGEFDFNF